MNDEGNSRGSLELQVVAVLTDALAQSPWTRAELFWSMVGPSTSSELTFVPEIGVGLEDAPTPRDLQPLLRRLKSSMADPERGTWFSVVVVLQPSGPEFHYDDEREVFWLSEDPYEETDDLGQAPQDSDWQAELLRYPRSREHVPSWLAERDVWVQVEPPAAHEGLLAQRPWAAVWSEIPQAVGSRLCTPAYWPHGLAALQRDVTADLLHRLRQEPERIVELGQGVHPRGDHAAVERSLGQLVEHFVSNADLLAYRHDVHG